eukprot:gene17109-biopygen9836
MARACGAPHGTGMWRTSLHGHVGNFRARSRTPPTPNCNPLVLGETANPASGPRPVRVRFFDFYRAPRVRSASVAAFPTWPQRGRGGVGGAGTGEQGAARPHSPTREKRKRTRAGRGPRDPNKTTT